jgi:lipopolysaccharide export LptBFGC system permease protein LptF
VTILVGVAALDYRGVVGAVPPVPPACFPPDAPLCNDQRNELLERRRERADQLEAAFAWRALLYALAVIALVAGAFAVLYRFHGKLTVLFVVLGCGLVGAALQVTVV